MLKLLGLIFLFWILSGLIKLGIFVWRVKQQITKAQNNYAASQSPLAEGAIEADQCPKCGVFGNQPCSNPNCPK